MTTRPQNAHWLAAPENHNAPRAYEPEECLCLSRSLACGRSASTRRGLAIGPGVSKATFSAVDNHAWNRLMRWIRAKYAGKSKLSMAEMRRRFCDTGWRFAHNGVVFTGASSVAVTRYRYRGSNIPTPWTPKPPAT